MTNFAGSEPLVIRSSADAVSVVPYLLGFHPQESLVAVGYEGPHGSCAIRMDLDEPLPGPLEDTTNRISHMLADNGFDRAFLIGYGTDADVAPLILAVARRLADRGVEVGEVLRVHEGRWWSYRCDKPGCCPAEGTPFDISTTVIAAQATVAGQVALASRAELARTLAPLGGAVGAVMREATRRAERRLAAARRAADNAPPGSIPAGGLRVQEGVPLVQRIVARLPELPTDEEIAWLGVLLTHVRVRDEAWVRIAPDQASDHVILWREVLRRVAPQYVPAPAGLLAYAAFIAGDGGLANVALDRAFDADPSYTMAVLLRDVIQAGVPPSAALIRMTPEELAEAWSDLHAPDDPPESDPDPFDAQLPEPDPDPFEAPPPEPDPDEWPPAGEPTCDAPDDPMSSDLRPLPPDPEPMPPDPDADLSASWPPEEPESPPTDLPAALLSPGKEVDEEP